MRRTLPFLACLLLMNLAFFAFVYEESAVLSPSVAVDINNTCRHAPFYPLALNDVRGSLSNVRLAPEGAQHGFVPFFDAPLKVMEQRIALHRNTKTLMETSAAAESTRSDATATDEGVFSDFECLDVFETERRRCLVVNFCYEHSIIFADDRESTRATALRNSTALPPMERALVREPAQAESGAEPDYAESFSFKLYLSPSRANVDAPGRRCLRIQRSAEQLADDNRHASGREASAQRTSPFELCDNGRPAFFVHACGLKMIHPLEVTTKFAEIPNGAQWIDGDNPAIIFSRHYPVQFLHSVMDDLFGLFINVHYNMPSKWRHGGGADALVNGSAQMSVTAAETLPLTFVFLDNHMAEITGQLRFLFPNARFLFARDHFGLFPRDSVRPAVLQAKESRTGVICFRRALVGSPGYSMMIHGANARNLHRDVRTWRRPLLFDEPTMSQATAAFADHVIHMLGLPSKQEMQARIDSGAMREYVLIIDRTSNRRVSDVPALKLVVETALDNLNILRGDEILRQYEVKVVKFELLSIEEQVLHALRAKMFIAVHGSAQVNLLYMRPNTHYIELLTPRFTVGAPVFYQIADSLGIKTSSMPLSEVDCTGPAHHQATYNVDFAPLMQMIQLHLGSILR